MCGWVRVGCGGEGVARGMPTLARAGTHKGGSLWVGSEDACGVAEERARRTQPMGEASLLEGLRVAVLCVRGRRHVAATLAVRLDLSRGSRRERAQREEGSR